MSLKLRDALRSTAAWRISLWTTVAFAAGTAVAFSIMYVLVAHDIQRRTDKWLSGEAEVLADVTANTPRDSLYDRLVEEVAELASHEVPTDPSDKGTRKNTVFFLDARAGQQPIWVGPGPMDSFVAALRNAELVPGVPQTIHVSGWRQPFRVVFHVNESGSKLYLGFSDLAATGMMHRLTVSFLVVGAGIVLLGFIISSAGAFRTLQRVERIAGAVSKIGSEDLAQRLPEGSRSDEISRLSRTFNNMLDRIQASVHELHVLTDSVAHDLKSPVTAIRGSLEVALSEANESTWRDTVADAIEKLDRLSQTLNTALDLAEADAGALQLHREPVDLGNLLRQLVDLYEPAMAERNHELACQFEEGVVIDADLSLLHRVLANLLDNEIAHLPPSRSVVITLRGGESQAELTVEDDGPGFTPELKDKAFERFVKGEQSTGHGLGLAFVYAVVRAHGGNVTIKDRSGPGAVITLQLPIMSAAIV